MRSFAVAPLLVASTVALPELFISKRDRHTNGATADFVRKVGIDKRSGTLGTNIYDVLSWSTGGAYYANVTVGTPPQQQVVILDTGSADLYFDASSAETCQTTGQFSCQGGTFNAKDSSTYNIVQQSPAFNTSFGDGSTAYGPYSSDVFGIGDVRISNVQFGVADTVNSTTGYAIGLMGVGYSQIEATYNPYPNVPEVLAGSGVINSRLYSVYLNDEDDVSGSILFGGIDTTKYTGDLVTLDLLPMEGTGEVNQFVSVVTGVNATVGGKTKTLFSGGETGYAAYGRNSGSLPVLLDTGSTAWSVSQSDWDKYFAPVFTFVQDDGVCSCSYANSDDSVSLEFGGKVTITVPAREFIVPLVNTTTQEQLQLGPNDDACVFLISPAPATGEGFQTLGDAVLRSMYVVFDLDNGQVSIAQANTNSNASPNIVTVSAGPSGVAKAVSGVVTASQNTWTIAPTATNTLGAYTVSTVSNTLGTATGDAAIPETARVSGVFSASNTASPSSGSGSGSNSGTGSSSSASSTKNAAAGLVVPTASFAGVWVAGLSVLCAAIGVGIVM